MTITLTTEGSRWQFRFVSTDEIAFSERVWTAEIRDERGLEWSRCDELFFPDVISTIADPSVG